MIDPRAEIGPKPDLVQRIMLRDLAKGPIYKIIRAVKDGPFCPAYIMWLQTVHEPGDPENVMERSPHIGAAISGHPVHWERVFMAAGPGTRRITRTEYDKAIAEMVRNKKAGKYDPRLSPFDPVRIEAMEIPFARKP